MKSRKATFFGRLAMATAISTGGLIAVVNIASSGSTSRMHLSDHVLLVGTYKGVKGQYTSIQAAVNAAAPGDTILVAPGDYHETADIQNPPTGSALDHGGFGSVLITTPNITLRGMNRNTVIVDGTKAGAPACSKNLADQTYGPTSDGKAIGRNGIVVYLADNVSVENLTTCNFLSGSKDSGNGIWWNGGADTATIGLHGYTGTYLTATSTFFNGEQTAGTYGIFSSDAAGPGLWDTIYASNQNDSGMYIGACQQVCNTTVNHAWMEYNALGYSGTNSGGQLIFENSMFDNNEDGFDTNTQIEGDPPAPQNGACPGNAISKITHTHSCWVVINSTFANNNNPNTPRAGSAAAGPTGTGMTISGGENDTVMNNKFINNGAWGVLFIPYPASSSLTGEYGQSCIGTGGFDNALFGCVYDPKNDALIKNTFVNDGSFKNASNGDFGQITLNSGEPSNCYVGNIAPQGSAPSNLAKTQSKCGVTTKSANSGGTLFNQVLCDTGYGGCTSAMKYPQPTGVIMHPLPPAKSLVTMPNPCLGVPSNAWCKSGKSI